MVLLYEDPRKKMTQPKTMIYPIPSHKAVYFRVPKVASTSLLLALRKVDPADKSDEYDKSHFKFTFVRNPFDRLASCYRHVIRRGTPEVLDGCPGMSRTMSFETFVEALSKIEKPEKMDMHFRPQYTFFPEKPDYIGKFENLKEDFAEICQKIGLHPPELLHRNSTDKTIFKDYYRDSKILQKVVNCYKKDFEMFGYSKEGM